MSSGTGLERRLTHRGRAFCFVATETRKVDAERHGLTSAETWYLVSLIGHRWPTVPVHRDEPGSELDARLLEWLEAFVFPDAPPAPATAGSPQHSRGA